MRCGWIVITNSQHLLMSAFGLPEEVTALFDGDAEDTDFQEVRTHLTETYGQSPEVEMIIGKLREMSGHCSNWTS